MTAPQFRRCPITLSAANGSDGELEWQKAVLDNSLWSRNGADMIFF